ncbi:MAG: AAA family ATPase [Pseudomonadales bacterium]|nr:AAA family ATPase [Pseudomonadales bacterium]
MAARVGAERRHLTVLFCDVVGSTEMSTRMDPEDLRNIMRGFEDDVSRLVDQHGGFVARYMGDGVLAYYGYPSAHEDDAERAVRCALELIETAGTEEVSLRVGIATGDVVVGDIVGVGSAQERSVVGQTPNLAARMQSIAPADGVVISQATHDLVGELFEYIELGDQVLKGFEHPVPAWQVRSERKGVSRFESQRSQSGAFYGRQDELEGVIELCESALEGRGQIVTVTAEPGMGKSRLTYEVEQRLGNRNLQIAQFNCSPHFNNTALYPVSSRVEFESGFANGDTVDEKMAKLEEFLENAGQGSLRYVAALLSLLFGERYEMAPDNADQQMEQTLKAIENQILKMATAKPLLVLVEDLHWCDATTLDLIHRVAQQIENLPIVILTTARPLASVPWRELSYATEIELTRLDNEACMQIVDQLAGPGVLDDDITDQIIQKADKVPLFVEELTKSVLVSLDSLRVPNTLQDSLMERLDLLADAKEVAQIGSVLGREFSRELLAMIVPVGTPLELSLDKLVDADVLEVNEARESTGSTFRFKHALLRDAAYESLLNEKRRELHARVAAELENNFIEILNRQPELVAHHLTQSNQIRKAVVMWQRAGMQATGIAAYPEAIDHFRTAVDLIPQLGEGEISVVLEIELQGMLGNAISRSRGYAAGEVETAFQRELELSQKLGDRDKFSALRRLGTYYIVRADFELARQVTDECLTIAEALDDPAFLIDAYNALGHVQAYTGELAAGRVSLEKAIAIYKDNLGSSLTYVTEQDPAMSALALACVVAWLMGDTDVGAGYKEELLSSAQAAGSPFDNAYANTWAAVFETLRRNFPLASQHAYTAMTLGSKYSLALWERFSAVLHGCAQQTLTESSDQTAIIGHNVEGYVATGAVLVEPLLRALHARSCRDVQELTQANQSVDQAIAQAKMHKEMFLYPQILQIKADLNLLSDASQDADRLLRD